MTDRPSEGELGRGAVAAALAAGAVAVCAAGWGYVFDGQAPYGDDNSAHLALLLHIADLWRSGVTDLWWHHPNLGLPLFLAYQPLPGLVSGTLGALFAETAPRVALYKGSIIALWASMPAAWYLGGRWLGLDRREAVLFGLATLAVRDLHDVGFGFTAASYGGLYTQIWGMWLLPATVGAFRRYVFDRSLPLVAPVGLFVATSMSHLFCGMYAGIASVLWLAVAERRWARLRRSLVVFVPALALLAFWLGPLVAENHLAGGLPWKNEYYDGWPAAEMAGRVLGGDVFDAERGPWLTASIGVGVIAALFGERRRVETWVLALGACTILLFMGRTNFGSWYDTLPMHGQINVMRYMNGLHFCGLVLASIAAAAVWDRGRGLLRARVSSRRASQIAVVVAGVLVSLFSYQRSTAMAETLKTFDHRYETVQPVIEELRSGAGSRFAVSESLNTSAHFFRDLFPALADRAQLQSYALGYHATLSTYYAEYHRFDAPWARLFNVGHVLAREPYDDAAVAGLTRTLQSAPYEVYRLPNSEDWGYFDFVRTPAAVEGDYRDIRPVVRSLLAPGFDRRLLPRLKGATDASRRTGGPLLRLPDGRTLDWKDGEADRWISAMTNEVDGNAIASAVIDEDRGPNWYAATVRARSDERLLLKVNYFPYWQATVDGEAVDIDHVAPNFMAVDVPEGRHRVAFRYRNPPWQKGGLLFTLAVLGIWSLRTWSARPT